MELSAENFDEPDEAVLPHLLEDMVEVGGFTVGREIVDPGWRWSKDTKPSSAGNGARRTTWASGLKALGAWR